MNIIKRTFHSDPNIRYAREIKQGTIHVKKRAEMDKWHYSCWCLRVGVKDTKRFWHIVVIAATAKVWGYNDWTYFDGISKERQLHLLIITPITLLSCALLISIIFLLKNESKRLKGWHINVRLSNRNYVVAKRCHPDFVPIVRNLMYLAMIPSFLYLLLIIVTFDWMLLLSDT